MPPLELCEMGHMTYVDIVTHALAEKVSWEKVGDLGHEACGLLVSRGVVNRRMQYVRARNVAEVPTNSFVIDPELQREVKGWMNVTVLGMVHSHPAGEPRPSPMDEGTYVPDGWLYGIVGMVSGQPRLAMYKVVLGDFRKLRLKLV